MNTKTLLLFLSLFLTIVGCQSQLSVQSHPLGQMGLAGNAPGDMRGADTLKAYWFYNWVWQHSGASFYERSDGRYYPDWTGAGYCYPNCYHYEDLPSVPYGQDWSFGYRQPMYWRTAYTPENPTPYSDGCPWNLMLFNEPELWGFPGPHPLYAQSAAWVFADIYQRCSTYMIIGNNAVTGNSNAMVPQWVWDFISSVDGYLGTSWRTSPRVYWGVHCYQGLAAGANLCPTQIDRYRWELQNWRGTGQRLVVSEWNVTPDNSRPMSEMQTTFTSIMNWIANNAEGSAVYVDTDCNWCNPPTPLSLLWIYGGQYIGRTCRGAIYEWRGQGTVYCEPSGYQ